MSEKKQTKEKICKEIAAVRDEFSKLIDSLMDIETIVKELSAWRIMKDILLDDYHKKLLPIVQVESARKRRVAEEKDKEREKGIAKRAGSNLMQQIVSSMADTLDIKASLQALRTNIEKNGNKGGPDSAGLKYQIDVYFAENLPDFNGSWPNSEEKPDQLSFLGNMAGKDQGQGNELMNFDFGSLQVDQRLEAKQDIIEESHLNEVAPKRAGHMSVKRVSQVP
jgi:hypothetical protein